MAELFDRVGQVDHVAVTAADATGVYGPITEIATSTARSVVDTTLPGAWLVDKYAAGQRDLLRQSPRPPAQLVGANRPSAVRTPDPSSRSHP